MEQHSLRTDDCTEKVIKYYSDMVRFYDKVM